MDGYLLADWLAAGGALLQLLHELGVDPGLKTFAQHLLSVSRVVQGWLESYQSLWMVANPAGASGADTQN